MKKEKNEWPIYYPANLIVGNLESNVGVATLWTEKDKIVKGLDKDFFSVAGQLYTKNGINPLLRNILANPIIRVVVLCGKQLPGGSGQALINLINNGVDEKYEIIGSEKAFIDPEIPRETIELFRKSIEVVDLRGEDDPAKINAAIKKIEQGLKPFAKPEMFPQEARKADVFPSEVSGMNVREETVFECWIKIIRLIMYYGFVKDSQHGEKQKELTGFTTVVTGENPNDIVWSDEFPRTRKELEEYYSQVLTSKPAGIHYTYGQRLFDHKGIDQINSMIEQLKGALYSRRAVACTWDVEKDHNNSNSPCMDIVQALVQGQKLYLTVYIRSNDMFKGWPENAFALRKLQKMIADAVNCDLGDLVIISNSAHIYESDWNQAKELVEKYGRKHRCKPDPRGNFVISIDREKKEIVVEHQSPDGISLREYRSKSALEMFEIMVCHDAFSEQLHGMYLGSELAKAEIALKKGIEYIQDRNLEI